MGRIVVEIPGAEFPESLMRLLPGGAVAPDARYRVIVEELDGNGRSTAKRNYGAALDGVAAGLVDVEGGRLIDEEELFARLLAKHPAIQD